MKYQICSIVLFFLSIVTFSQETDDKFDEKQFLKELAENACTCIDSVETFDKIKDSISSDIHKCIDKQVGAYQMGLKIATIKDLEKNAEEVNGKKQVNITIDLNPNSKEYKQNYFKIENYLMDNCKAIKNKINVNDKIGEKSLSNNSEAIKYYNLGLAEYKKEDYEKAILMYKKALVFDKNFAFAYDNIGICYRKLNKFDEAIDSYEKSLKIDPNGTMPLQNIAIAYIYKKEYKKAVKSYEKLAEIDENNPEIYYGIGNIYCNYLFDYEKSLDNLCHAYIIYIEQKSPYRTDAEKLIQIVFSKMKDDGKEAKFDEILKKYNISQN